MSPVTVTDTGWSDGLTELLESSCHAMTEADRALVLRAAERSVHAHQGQRRRSGEPYVFHPASVAVLARQLGLGAEAVAAAWLHDVVEDTSVTLADVAVEFGSEVATLVDGLTKVDGLHFDTVRAAEAEQMRRLLLHLAADPRAVVVKICDRLHNMRTVWALDSRRRERMARETLAVFAPLAHRLGFAAVRAELEDLAFSVLWPQRYRELSEAFERGAPERTRLVAAAISDVEGLLAVAGIAAAVTGRAKHLYAVAEKMQRSGIPLEQLHDLLGIRVIVEDTESCYRALGVIHCSEQFQPVQGSFKDYVAVPRVGVYSSLHTVVVAQGGHRFEVQIRSRAMHDAAERGPAAHWRYKQDAAGSDGPAAAGDVDAWVEALLAGLDGTMDLQELRVELAEHEVYAFTPKGDMIRLPGGACVLDFAYAIHTQVGDHAKVARVNGVDVPLTTPLRHGDRVEIVTAAHVERSPDWLDAVVTGRARSALRALLRRQDPDDVNLAGADRLLGWGVIEPDWPDVAERLGLGSVEGLLHAVGERRVARRAVQTAAGVLSGSLYQLDVEAVDRPGLLTDVTAAITTAGGDIVTSHSYTSNRRAHETYTVALSDHSAPAKLEAAVTAVDGVLMASVTASSAMRS